MIRHLRGFTIVEILIIISVLGILTTIGIMSWNGVTTWSRERAREQDVRQWASTFNLYKSRFIVYPDLPTGDGNAGSKRLCLGDTSYFAAFSNRCGQYQQNGQSPTKTTEAVDSTTMINNVKKVGNVPTNSGPAVKNTFVGPLVYLYQTTTGSSVAVDAYFIDFFETGPCSSMKGFGDALSSSDSEYSKIYPGVNGLVSGSGQTVYVCYLKQSFTYTKS